jgi:hypothetical protein
MILALISTMMLAVSWVLTGNSFFAFTTGFGLMLVIACAKEGRW